MINTIVLKNIDIIDASIDSTYLTNGVFAINTIFSFADALRRKYREKNGNDFTIKSVGIIYHDFQPKLLKHQKDKYLVKLKKHEATYNGSDPTIKYKAYADVKVSIIIEIADNFSKIDDEQIFKTVRKMRFSGGTFFLSSSDFSKHIQLFSIEPDNVDSLNEFINVFKRGFAVSDASDILEKYISENNIDPLDGILDFMEVYYYKNKKNEGTTPYYTLIPEIKKGHWYVPIGVGYNLISQKTPQEYTVSKRDKQTDHYYAENVISMADMLFVKNIDNINDILWEQNNNPEIGLFVYTGKNIK